MDSGKFIFKKLSVYLCEKSVHVRFFALASLLFSLDCPCGIIARDFQISIGLLQESSVLQNRRRNKALDGDDRPHPTHDWHVRLHPKPNGGLFLEKQERSVLEPRRGFLWNPAHRDRDRCHRTYDYRLGQSQTRNHRQSQIQNNARFFLVGTTRDPDCHSVAFLASRPTTLSAINENKSLPTAPGRMARRHFSNFIGFRGRPAEIRFRQTRTHQNPWPDPRLSFPVFRVFDFSGRYGTAMEILSNHLESSRGLFGSFWNFLCG